MTISFDLVNPLTWMCSMKTSIYGTQISLHLFLLPILGFIHNNYNYVHLMCLQSRDIQLWVGDHEVNSTCNTKQVFFVERSYFQVYLYQASCSDALVIADTTGVCIDSNIGRIRKEIWYRFGMVPPPSFQNGFNGSSCNLAYSKALLNVLRFENIDH